MAESQVRQNYAEESEKGVNDQVNMEFHAMYTMLSMVSELIPVPPTSLLVSRCQTVTRRVTVWTTDVYILFWLPSEVGWAISGCGARNERESHYGQRVE